MRRPPARSETPPARVAFRAHAALGEAMALDPGGSGMIAAALRGKQPSPQAFGFFFDMPGPLTFDPEAIQDGIAILCLDGPIEKRDGGWCHNYEAIQREIGAALACPECKAVVLKIDSPGGVAAGMGETHKAIRRLRKEHGKPVIAYVDEMACSAAYHLASACDEIWTTEAGHLGSIGVILCTVDESARLEKEGIAVKYVVTGARKADLHPGNPVTEEVLAVAQAKVDTLGQQFFRAVGKSRGDRGLTAEKAEGLQAAVFIGEDAVSEGLADGVASWTKFLDFLKASIGASTPEARTFSVLPPNRGSKARAKTMAKTTPLQAAAAKDADAKKKGALAAAFSTIASALGIGGVTPTPEGRMSKRTETTKHTIVEEDDSDDMDEEAEEEEERAEDSETDKSDAGSDADASAEEEEESKGKAEEEKAIARATSRAWKAAQAAYQAEALKSEHPNAVLLRSPERLRREARRATGSANLDGAMTALSRFRASGAEESAKAIQKAADLEARTAKLEADTKRQQIEALVKDAKAAGKAMATTKEGRAHLREHGQKHGPADLKALIAKLPTVARTTETGERVPALDGKGNVAGAPSADAQMESMLATMTAGMSVEEAAKFREGFAQRLATTNGAARAPRI